MIYVVATSQVKPESRDAFIKGAKECIAATRTEKGCISYESHTSINDPQSFRGGRALGDPRGSQCARPGAAYESLARIFRAAEGVANRDRDHQRRQGREAVSIFA